MKIAVWVLAAVIGLGTIGGLVYIGTHDLVRQHVRNNRSSSVASHSSSDASAQEAGAVDTTGIRNPKATSGKQTFHINVDGQKREFIVYRPKDLEQSEEVPVVFMYHGSGGTGEIMYDETTWKEQADQNGFMVVYPTGMKYHTFDDEGVYKGKVQENVTHYETKWNSYQLTTLLDPQYPNQTLADDVKFTEDMVSFVNENYATDTSRFYASGFSNGAQMVERLIVEKPDTFAAFAVNSGGKVIHGTMEGLTEHGMTVTPRPIAQTIGDSDPKITFSLGVDKFPTDESAVADGYPLKDEYISPYLELEGLSDQYTYENVDNAGHFTYDHSLTGADNEYDFYIVGNMGHVYPNGENNRFDAAKILWSFFDQFTL